MNNNLCKELVHAEIVRMGYWLGVKQEGTLLMLMQTEITKLFDPDKLNKGEKLADICNRIFDYCGKYKIDLSELPEIDNCSLWDMCKCLTDEMECYRCDMKSMRFENIKKLLSMCYMYAKENNIDIDYEWNRKYEILKKMKKERKV